MRDPQNGQLDDLLERARTGDSLAVDQLLQMYRGQLRRMVMFRMDDRLAPRVDASDIVQDTLLEAAKRLQAYLREPVVPFYVWLRQIAADRLVDLHRRHIQAERRSVRREASLGLSQSSVMCLADRLVTTSAGPLRRLIREERVQRVRQALDGLADADREILTLRHLEQLKFSDCAAVMSVSLTAAKKRYLRALEQLQATLDREPK